MSDYVASYHAQLLYDHRLNILYAFAAICVIYKMIYISALASRAPRLIRMAMKVSAVGVGTIIAMKALGRFQGDDAAQALDIIRELSWCALLFSIAYYFEKLTRTPKS